MAVPEDGIVRALLLVPFTLTFLFVPFFPVALYGAYLLIITAFWYVTTSRQLPFGADIRYAACLIVAFYIFVLVNAFFTGSNTAVDLLSFGRTALLVTIFMMAFLVVYFGCCSDQENRLFMIKGVGWFAVVLGISSLVFPTSNSEILFFFDLPKLDREWQSPLVHDWVSSMHGEIRSLNFGGIEAFLIDKNISTKPIGPFVNENHYASALGISGLVACGMLLDRYYLQSDQHWIRGLGALLIVVGFWIVTNSRAATAFFSLSLFLMIIGRQFNPFLKSGIAFITAVLLLWLVCIFVPGLLPGRSVIWAQVLGVWYEHLWFGVGLGSFHSLRLIADPALGDVWMSAHNLFLEYLSVAGIVGFCFLVACVAVFSAKNLSISSTAHRSYTQHSLVMAVLFAMLHGLVDYSPGLPPNLLLLSFVLGIGAAGYRREKTDKVTEGPYMTFLANFVCVVAMVAVILVGRTEYVVQQARSNAIPALLEWEGRIVTDETVNGIVELRNTFMTIPAREMDWLMANVLLAGRLMEPDYLERSMACFRLYQSRGVEDPLTALTLAVEQESRTREIPPVACWK